MLVKPRRNSGRWRAPFPPNGIIDQVVSAAIVLVAVAVLAVAITIVTGGFN